jgi:hypothetical protein
MHTFMASRHLLSVLIAGLALAVAACSGTVTVTSTGSGSSPTTGSTATTTSGSGSTPAPTATCATLLPGAIANGSPASTAFGDAPLPANSFVAPVSTFLAGGSALWTILLDQGCTNGMSASAVRSFFSSQYPASGWAYAPKLPFDGGYFAPCGDAYCWGKDTPQRFVGLENVTDHGGATTYQLRLFLPPTAPSCTDPNFTMSPIHGYQTFVEVFTYYVALPPLSLIAPDDATGGQKGLEICSAGSVSSIITFMQTELPKQGWSLLSGSGGNQTWQQSGKQVHWSVSSATGWEIDWRVPLPA